MQTFLPYPNFAESAAVLDDKRLGNQRNEALVLLRVLRGRTRGWKRHPAVRMWQGHERALTAYGLAICSEWTERGYADTVAEQLREEAADAPLDSIAPPRWLGNEAFHASHRGNLVRKDPEHYGPLWPDADPGASYVWPLSLRT